MKSKTGSFASLIAITLVSCASAAKVIPATENPQRLRETEEAAIYELLLHDECKNSYHNSSVLLADQTISAPDFDEESLFGVEPSLDKETLDQYVKINHTTQAFAPELSGLQFCELITSDELDALTQKDSNWYNDHMVIRFSKVGFNSSLDQALVYREYNCGGECAGGDLYFLIRLTDNSWSIENVVGGWNS